MQDGGCDIGGSKTVSPGGQRGRGRVYFRAVGDWGEYVRGYGADGSGRAGRASSYGADCRSVCHCVGHAKRGGGRVKAVPHIAPAEEKGVRELEEGIKRGLSK